MTPLSELKALALAAPEVVFDNETESGRFYAAANPARILSLIAALEKAREALGGYANPYFEKPQGLRAREALAEIEEILK